MTVVSRDESFEKLLLFLRQSRGFDFTGYKRSTLQRRVKHRMDQVGISNYPDYHEYLKQHHEEFSFLFTTILINVTSFFRDPPAWEYLSAEVLPRLIAAKGATEPIRVWSAGCASGEEAYTVAMVLVEALGMSQFRERVKVYATDVDEDALRKARQGIFVDKDLEEVPAGLREKYFEASGGRYLFRGDLRRTVIFGRHDLLQDAPISRIDLLLCRNTLMYFEAETQARILARLHYALDDQGFLFVGKAEMLLTRESIFAPLDLKHRVFTKVGGPTLPERKPPDTIAVEVREASNPQIRLRESAFDTALVAQIVVDPSGYLLLANASARQLFGLVAADIGRPIQDLEVSYRPLELRSRLDQVLRERQPLEVSQVERHLPSGATQVLDVSVAPLLDPEGDLLGASVAFADVSNYNQVHSQLERSRQELETASEELQSTNEELETTNEELQSTVEELETTNEELQSSNEELETMNEELESTNAQLQAINAELQQRSLQLDQVNRFMESILTGLRSGVVVVGTDLRVQLWNQRAEDLWGVRATEVVGQSLLTLDIGLPVADLAVPIRDCLAGKDGGSREVVLASTNRRGKSIRCKVMCTPLMGPSGPPEGAILLMEDATVPSLVRPG
ncbi:MAG TPA: CheR family methyltransferase [Candidatus Eisenbacteria bacterium]|nr:CheR family methyltransferase [Candidatus Eisenbacteria bacterium]